MLFFFCTWHSCAGATRYTCATTSHRRVACTSTSHVISTACIASSDVGGVTSGRCEEHVSPRRHRLTDVDCSIITRHISSSTVVTDCIDELQQVALFGKKTVELEGSDGSN